MAIQIRRGTKAGWESNNSNIVAGEPVITTDTEQVFIGTGNGTYVEMAKKSDIFVPDGAITTAKLDSSSVTTAKLADGSVTTAKIGNSAVTTAKIQDGAVTDSKLTANLLSEINDYTEEPTRTYESAVLYNLNNLSEGIRCTITNNVITPDPNGSTYVTPYIPISEFIAKGMILVRQQRSPLVRFYDGNHGFVSSKNTSSIGSTYEFPENTEYVVFEYSESYYGNPYAIYGNKENVEKVSTKYGYGTSLYSSEIKTITFTKSSEGTSDAVEVALLPNETYTFSTSGYFTMSAQTAHGDSVGTVGGTNINNGTFTNSKGAIKLVPSSANNGTSITITGAFPKLQVNMPSLELVADNFNDEALDAIADGLGLHSGQGIDAVYYNCTHYGVLPSSSDNTSALNALITRVNENGGGIIWMPNGTYNFLKESSSSAMHGNAWNNVYLKSHVSIMGESLDSTILKLSGATNTGCSLFGYFSQDNDDAILEGCLFSNFTVDMSELTMASYTHRGKAFYVSGIKDCVFRDLRLLSTPSTALGIDMLDNVVIDSVYVYQGGRQWSANKSGGAGIGIGTGKWANENYIIRNCVCDSCGHFGIFLEDQGMFAANPTRYYSKGQIIANNIVRNGRNYGIGLRGGRYVSITSNNVYSNANGGIYLDYGADQSIVSNNLISDTTNAINFGNESSTFACTKIAVINNAFAGCTNGVVQTLTPTDCVIQNNITL